MKKIYLLGLIVLITISVSAQQAINGGITPPDNQIETEDSSNDLESDFYAKRGHHNKAFGDTMYYQDFAGGLPTGWSIVNNNPNNFQWTWNTVYLQGQFSTTRTEIKSTTAANGFMSLPVDFFNTPTPTTGRVPMDTYFQSDTITITPTPSVWVSYQQYVRYCCNSSNKLVLQVSTDDFITFTEFDAKNGLAVNAGNTSNAVGGQTNIINISTAVSNVSQFKVRFYSQGIGRYFWMIDDFAVIEGVENDLELTDPYMEFNQANYTYYPFYNQIPYDLFPPLPFFGRIYNNGSNTQTNVRLEATVTHTADASGGPGVGLIYATSQNTFPTNMASGSITDSVVPVLTGNPKFVPLLLGDFRVDFLATSDSVDGNFGNETAIAEFRTTDTVFARDDNGFGGGTGPGSYVRGGQSGGTTVGDKFGTMYIIESRTGNGGALKAPSSITYFVTDDPQNIGVEIVPKIWAFNEDSLRINGANFSVDRAFGAEVASAFIPYTVQSSDTNSFLTLPLDNGPAVFNGLDSGQYVVGWEVTNTNGGNNFEVANDATTAALQSAVTSFNFHAHSPTWGWVSVNPVIRLNMPPVLVGIDENQKELTTLTIAPNPSNGLFDLSLNAIAGNDFQMEVRNNLGQIVFNDQLSAKGEFNRTFDFSSFDKGVYTILLSNKVERLTKKVIIQ